MSKRQMFGLFSYEYDYYEWENLIVISQDNKKLLEYIEKEKKRT